jgi:mannose-6-phosphate isomerase-like protein (cupin superfamily)
MKLQDGDYVMSNIAPSRRTQPLWFIDNVVHVHVDGDASGGALAVLEDRGRRGSMPPLHVHRRDDETFFVLEGEVTLFVANEQIVLGPGQSVLAPRDVPHAYRVESEEARWLVITTPAGFDDFVREVAEPAPADELPPGERPVDPAFLAQAAAKAGIEILGPPGALPG